MLPGRASPRLGLASILALVVCGALAEAAPETSPRPLARPAGLADAPGPRLASDPRPAPDPKAAPVPLARPADPSAGLDAEQAPGSLFALESRTAPVPQAMPGPQAMPVPQAAPGPLLLLDPSPVPGSLFSLGRPPASGLPIAPVVLGPPGPSDPVLTVSLHPEARPEDIVERARAARAALLSPARVAPPDASVRRATGPAGAICGSRSILGQPLAAIPGRLRGCGVAEPVRVTAVAGVRLSTPAVMDCGTARALGAWVEGSVRPAVGARGGGIEGLQVAAHYACRTRNNRPGAKISEHGRGRAIDIAALLLADGSRITVLKGWRRRGAGAILRAIHASACGPFGTVLGPDGDRFHQDHLHLDTTPRRSAYCR